MMPYEDIAFPLVDLPAVSPEHAVPWLASALQMADACLLVVDPGAADCLERLEQALAVLGERRVQLVPDWSAVSPDGDSNETFVLRFPALLVAS